MYIEFRNGIDDCLFVFDYSDESSLQDWLAGDNEFDVLLPIFSGSLMKSDEVKRIIATLIQSKTDWFHTIGPDSEWLHDEIDIESVRLGRQQKVGDGSPMTVWEDDMCKFDEIADYVFDGGCGGNEKKVVVVIGEPADYSRFIAELKKVRDREQPD